MSYLLQFARRPDSIEAPTPTSRVDEHTRLNLPGFYGDAFVRVFVEDTSARVRRRDRGYAPRFDLAIADCIETINLEFSVSTPELRENSLFKIDTLLAALHGFRDALAVEAELAAQRQR